MNNLTKPIIIGSVIIAVAVLGSQWMKQNSIEKQQQAELFAKQQESNTEQANRAYKELQLGFCLDDAESDYWEYMRINGTEKADGTIWALNSFWDRAEEKKQTAINNCYKQWK